MRMATRAIFYGIGEEQTVSIWQCQASESIHKSTQVKICGLKGFPMIASHPLPSRIPYRYSYPRSSRVPTTVKTSRRIFSDPRPPMVLFLPIFAELILTPKENGRR